MQYNLPPLKVNGIVTALPSKKYQYPYLCISTLIMACLCTNTFSMDHLTSARHTLRTEIEGLQAVLDRLDAAFDHVVHLLLQCRGKVIVSGMGKSGLIGQKIAATLASTGTPAFFMHPGEALHGDLGMIGASDYLLLLSYSGETEELLRLLAYALEHDLPAISITGEPASTLAKKAQQHLNVAIPKEACPLALAPTTSTTAMLALGDALAVALMEARQFQPEDFARFHPGGSLGYQLLTTVGEVMRTDRLPFVAPDIAPVDLLMRMSEGQLGLAIVGTPDNVEGLITDGDLRRGIVRFGRLADMDLGQVGSKDPIMVPASQKVGEVQALMREKKITAVLVQEAGTVVGVYQIFGHR